MIIDEYEFFARKHGHNPVFATVDVVYDDGEEIYDTVIKMDTSVDEKDELSDKGDYTYIVYPDKDVWLCCTSRGGHYQIHIDVLSGMTAREMESAGIESDIIYSE